jgi:hypothetical protein
MPVYNTIQEAPKDKTPFFSTEKQISQKEFMLNFIERIGKSSEEERNAMIESVGGIKVHFWVRHKDGRVSDAGGMIPMKGLVESLKTTTDAIIEQIKAQSGTPVHEPKDIPLDLGIPDSDLTFVG